MSNIEKTQKKLDTKNGFFITVMDTATEKEIEKATAERIKQFGSLTGYLKNLFNKGHKEVYIEPRIKNGSSHKLCGVPFKLKLGATPQAINTTETLPATSTPVTQEAIPMPGLMGGQIGLGQYMEAHSSMRALQTLQQDHAELKMKFESLQAEKDRLKDENVDLKRANDRLEDKIERKGPLDGIDINQALPALLGLLKPQQPAAGLNAPQKQLSPIKEAVRQSIESEGMPDAIIENLYKILENYIGNNEKFINEFEALLNQNNLKSV